jgi:hypothetical protein
MRQNILPLLELHDVDLVLSVQPFPAFRSCSTATRGLSTLTQSMKRTAAAEP